MIDKQNQIKSLEHQFGEAFINQRFSEGVEISSELLSLDNNNLDYQLHLAQCLTRNHQRNDAIPIFKKYLQFYPEDTNVIEELYVAYQFTDRWEENAAFLEEIHQRLPKNEEIQKKLFNTYITLHSPKIIHLLEEMLESNPDQQYYACTLGSYTSIFNGEGVLDKYAKAYAIDPDDGHINELLGQYYAEEGKIDLAFKYTIKSLTCKKNSFIEYMGESINYSSGKDFAEIKSSEIRKIYKDEKGPEEVNLNEEEKMLIRTKLTSKITLGTLNKLFRETKVLNETFDRVENAYKLAGNYNNSGIVAMHLLYYAEEYVSTKKIGERIINLLLKDPSINMPEKYTSIFRWFKKKSKNPVQITNSLIRDTLIGSEYIIKVNDPNKSFSQECKRLEDEYVTQLFLNNHISEYEREFRGETYEKTGGIIRKPRLFFKNNNKAIFIQIKTDSESLDEIISKGDSDQTAKNMIAAIYSLATIHTIATSALQNEGKDYYFKTADGNNNAYVSIVPELNYLENLEKRFISRLGKNIKLENFEAAYKKYIGFSKTKFFLHGDYYPTNILSEGQVIDLEKRCVGSPMLDIAHLLEHPEVESTLIYLEGYAKCFEKVNENLGKDGRYIYKIINQEYAKNALHVNLCLTGAMLAQNNIPYAQAHLQRAIEIADADGAKNLKEAIVDYIRASPHDSLKQIL